jgi:hypothetical protein
MVCVMLDRERKSAFVMLKRKSSSVVLSGIKTEGGVDWDSAQRIRPSPLTAGVLWEIS